MEITDSVSAHSVLRRSDRSREFVGLECAVHGLTRSRLLEPLNLRLENPTVTVLTNGFVLELEEFCAKEGQGVSYLVFLLNELVGGDTQFDV